MFDADLEDIVMFKGSFKRISNLTCLSLDFAVRTNKLVSIKFIYVSTILGSETDSYKNVINL